MSEMEDKDSLDLDFPSENNNLSLKHLQNHSKLSMNDINSKNFTDLMERETDPVSRSQNPLRQSGNAMKFQNAYGSTSELATKRRVEKEINLQMESMQKQLENVESKNLDLVKIRKKVTQELDQKTREVKFLEKQCYEQQNEISQLKAQLESTVRVTSKQGGGRTFTAPSHILSSQQHIQHQQQQLPKLMDEIKSLQDVVHQIEKENQALKERNSDYGMKIKVLQDALTFRSEEIGLSGHSDLLLKVSSLKGEVVALKKELTSKITSVDSVEQEKKSLLTEQKSLQEQIASIQDRLAKSQQENFKLSNNDLALLLKTTEQERDLLLEYIQQNMTKTLALTKQIEVLENESRISMQKIFLLEKTHQDNNENFERNKTLLNSLENENLDLKHKMKEILQEHDQQSYELESCKKHFNRKSVETEENEKIQATLFTQVSETRVLTCLFPHVKYIVFSFYIFLVES
jgi:chromosome segregation ATPase